MRYERSVHAAVNCVGKYDKLTVQLERLRSSPSGTDSELLGDALGDGLGDTRGVPPAAEDVGPPSDANCRSDGPGGAYGDPGVRLPLGLGARLCLGLRDEHPGPVQLGTAMDCLLEAATPVTAMLALLRLGWETRRLPLRCSMVPLRTSMDIVLTAVRLRQKKRLPLGVLRVVIGPGARSVAGGTRFGVFCTRCTFLGVVSFLHEGLRSLRLSNILNLCSSAFSQSLTRTASL